MIGGESGPDNFQREIRSPVWIKGDFGNIMQSDMQAFPVREAYFEGAVSVEHGEGWMRPWRLPCDRLELFPSPGSDLVSRGRCASGVRLRVRTASRRLGLDFMPLNRTSWNHAHFLDLTLDNAIIATRGIPYGGEQVLFSDLPPGLKTLEIWLPHATPIEVQRLWVDAGCTIEAEADKRFRWVTYGSSLTHCARASGSARIWPAVVSRQMDWHLTSLGYGGNCCLEPMMALMLRDLSADLFTLKLGVNCINGALSPRTFPAAVIGLVSIIREKHPHTPIGLISPIAYPPRESTPNVLNYTLEGMRRDMEDVFQCLRGRGDEHLYYFNGLDLFSVDEIDIYAEDQCHPNGVGIELMGRNFLERIMPGLPV